VARAPVGGGALGPGPPRAPGDAARAPTPRPDRAALFPPLYDIFAAAKAAGAAAAWLSGAGSSVAALCPKDTGRAVAAAMRQALEAAGYEGRALATRIAPRGAEVARVELVEVER